MSEIKQWRENIGKPEAYMIMCDVLDVLREKEAIKKAVYERLKQAPSTYEWIPCSERLPEKETEVIYSLENIVSTGYMTDRDYYGSVIDLHWKDMECGAWICPEAWMPMPSPWKGDK